MTKQIRLQVRRDTSANWASANPVLADGEIGYDTTEKNQKIGDGTTTWSLLPWTGSGGDVEGPASSTQGNMVSFADATGKVLADSGFQVLFDEDWTRYVIMSHVMFDDVGTKDIRLRSMGYQADVGAYKKCIRNPTFWNVDDDVEDLTGWSATAGTNVTVNSTTVITEETSQGSHALRVNVTVTQVSGSSLVIKQDACRNLSHLKKYETGIRFGVTPDASTTLLFETRSDYQYERWYWPTYAVPAVTVWRYPTDNVPTLDDTFEDFVGEEALITLSNLPTGTYNIDISGILIYGDFVLDMSIYDYTSNDDIGLGLYISNYDDAPVNFLADSIPLCRFRGVSPDTPEQPMQGDIWIDTTATPVVKIYGTTWVSLN